MKIIDPIVSIPCTGLSLSHAAEDENVYKHNESQNVLDLANVKRRPDEWLGWVVRNDSRVSWFFTKEEFVYFVYVLRFSEIGKIKCYLSNNIL